ncbi:1,2-phenylacetyl-CoA epoxidase subunit PaaC [Pontibacter sp. SGAir0037]|uniref:1,2-phenylacetyl-CoA epoxidase subunit PaaC n=1 Tax=Pontibacter sp. SGAir0037 TaxID=2571030 RepID=UPI0010CD108C|nr:1,2-phenylacetyl-CoA epoxidase subunit PaaC [Pontibacter sp. SGAir0037]QCR22923.1 phenylacetate-CoA oxygenase subunit PaaI [Pontibacter sp. SGAir0037]
MNAQALKDLFYKVADDQLILGHRNSEWTGFGPILEEDIAFSSMAQDKIGHSLAFYTLLQELGEAEPDTVAFTRSAARFHNCQLVELPNGEYDFSLMRHFLYDNAEMIRFEMFSQSAYEPLAKLATKLKGEIKYHVLHANTWIKNLGNSTEEAVLRLQTSLHEAVPYALGMFELSAFEEEMIAEGIYAGEEAAKAAWLERIQTVLNATQLRLPAIETVRPILGGRYGQHTEYLQPLLTEMSEVFNLDPTAEW